MIPENKKTLTKENRGIQEQHVEQLIKLLREENEAQNNYWLPLLRQIL